MGITSAKTLQKWQNLKQFGIEKCELLIIDDQKPFRSVFIFYFRQGLLDAWENDMYAEDFFPLHKTFSFHVEAYDSMRF